MVRYKENVQTDLAIYFLSCSSVKRRITYDADDADMTDQHDCKHTPPISLQFGEKEIMFPS